MISIIVPIYNSEKYLDRCINSLLNQTHVNFELLLINDGSTDSSGNICKKYVEKDKRVKLYTKINGGVSSARNLGLDNAKGEYICFVDSDDYVENDYLLKLYNKIKASDLVVCSYLYEKQNISVVEKLNDCELSVNCSLLNEILMKGAFMGPVCKLYKKDIIESNKIRFNTNIHSGEDTLFVYTYLLHINKISTIKDITYHYCIADNGLSHRKISIDEMRYICECFWNILLLFENRFPEFNKDNRYVWLVFELLVKQLESLKINFNFSDRKKRLMRIIESSYVNYIFYDKTILPKGIKRKLWDYLFRMHRVNILTLYSYLYDYK